jgi:tetratricopeptide (TPR) repeat protein
MKLIEFTGARRIPLIGRLDLLEEAERRLGRGGIHLLFFEGSGGIGKTALLEAILERSQWGGRAESLSGFCVAHDVVDLYHVDVHTPEGMIRRIMEVLGKWFFQEAQSLLPALERARLSGDMGASRQREEALHAAFFEELADVTKEGVVLAFDTLEVLDHERDPFQDELGEEAPALSAARWLFESFFPALQGNVLVLLAGRPGGVLPKLELLQKENDRILLRHVELEPFDQDETREYLKAIAQAEGRGGDGEAAARLWNWAEERGDIVHHLSGGKPILLALVAEMVARDWALPPAFERPLEELCRQGMEHWWPDVERALVVRFQESPTPVGTTLRALAWLRKGATPELLAQLLDLRNDDGTWDLYRATGYLDQAAQLALVKVRPGDRRVFLHDEMYALLERYVLQECSEEERDVVYGTILAHYRDLVRNLEQRVENPSPVAGSVRTLLRQAYVEEMHYHLCYSPPSGFAMYFWLAEEALGANDVEMDMLVRSEFLRTLSMLKETEIFLGSIPREASLDMAVRWGARALFAQSDPEAALRIFELVRQRWTKHAGKVELPWAHFQLYRALAKIRRASGEDWLDARDVLTGVVEAVERTLAFPPENPVIRARRWRAKIIKSLALNNLGYLDHQQGRYPEAVGHLRESAMLQRRLGMSALVSTLADLSYAMAMTGQFHHARLTAEEAERLAQRRGQMNLLAVALNVRAFIEGLDHHYQVALRYADRALEAAAQLPGHRVRGLSYLARARAYRYLWNSLCEPERAREAGLLDEALAAATQAAGLLRSSPAERVGALLERGCIYRELARRQHLEGKETEAAQAAHKSQSDLERVTVLAAALNLPRQQSLAWTDLGWLGYYLGKVEDVEQALQQAYEPLPKEYLFPKQGPLPPMAERKQKKEAALPFWSALGKAEMLRANLALDQALANSTNGHHQEQLRAAAKHITLSLAYDELVGDSYFELTRAEEGLHSRIVQDDLSIKTFHQYARQVAEEQGLSQPTRFQAFLQRMFGAADLWA